MCDDDCETRQTPEERRHLEQLLVGSAALRASMFTVATALVVSILAIIIALIQQPFGGLPSVLLPIVGLLLCLMAWMVYRVDRRAIKAGLDSASIARRLEGASETHIA